MSSSIGLDRLLPGWREDPDRPLQTQVGADRFLWLTGIRFAPSKSPE